ncbi:chaplin [Streptomyces sp. NPDC051684]|uniref:chaplin n=1 Tax=Streptomyces sp. NPDC051684 TaxID=3365670 RepID=UPI00379B4555
MKPLIKLGVTAAATGIAVLGTAGLAAADSDAFGVAENAPGVGTGNIVQVPAHVPVNATGNSGNIIGALNPTFDNTSSND